MTALASKASRADAAQDGRRRSGLRRAADGLVVLALAVVALALAAAVAPRLAGFEGLAITSGSMGKAAPVGSLVLTRDRLAAEVRVGDVIALERPGSPIVVHRVLAVETVDGRLVVETKGDANATPDPEPYPLPVQVPVMARSIPFVGYLVALLQVPLGWLLLIALPATAVAAAVIRDLWRADAELESSVAQVPAGVDLQPALDALRAEHAALRERAARALTAMKQQLDESRAEAAALRATVAAPGGAAAAPAPAELEARLASALRESDELRGRLRDTEGRLHEALAPDRRLPELERLLREAHGEIGSLRSALAAAAAVADRAAAPDPRLAELELLLADARAETAAVREQLDAAEARLAEAAAAELLVTRLGERVAHLEATARAGAPIAADDAAGPHLLYAATPAGYQLHAAEGPLPRPGEDVVVAGRAMTVVRLGISPLPGDRRRCAFVSPA